MQGIFEAQLSGKFNEDSYNIVFQEKRKDHSTKDQVMAIAKEYEVDILVIGLHGRKKEGEDHTICGSTVTQVSQASGVDSVLVVKGIEQRAKKDSGAFRFAVCLDGSANALKALESTFKFMDTSKDWIDVIHVEKLSVQSDSVKAAAEELFAAHGITNHTFNLIAFNPDNTREESILDHVHEASTPYVDFFVVANHGTGYSKHKDKGYLGRVAKGLLTKSKTNVLLVI